jgi:hypothetical protein
MEVTAVQVWAVQCEWRWRVRVKQSFGIRPSSPLPGGTGRSFSSHLGSSRLSSSKTVRGTKDSQDCMDDQAWAAKAAAGAKDRRQVRMTDQREQTGCQHMWGNDQTSSNNDTFGKNCLQQQWQRQQQ